MVIKQDPVTTLYCRSDGAILMPPDGHKFKRFRWTFGCKVPSGYRTITFQGKTYSVHAIICRAFHGLAPEGKPFVDHIDRCRSNNTPGNLHWTSNKENQDNADSVDRSVEKYGARACEDKAAYMKAYYAMHREEFKAHNKAFYAAKKAAGFVHRVIDGRRCWIKKELA